MSPALAGGFFTTRPPWKALNLVLNISSVLLHVFVCFFSQLYVCSPTQLQTTTSSNTLFCSQKQKRFDILTGLYR